MMQIEKEMPSWALPLTVAVGVMLLLVVGWRVWSANTEYVGPPKKMTPGMYNLREEVQKAVTQKR